MIPYENWHKITLYVAKQGHMLKMAPYIIQALLYASLQIGEGFW
jgi:hypothetical protein